MLFCHCQCHLQHVIPLGQCLKEFLTFSTDTPATFPTTVY